MRPVTPPAVAGEVEHALIFGAAHAALASGAGMRAGCALPHIAAELLASFRREDQRPARRLLAGPTFSLISTVRSTPFPHE